jgi:hypothetical protein
VRVPPFRVRLTTWYLAVIFASLAVYAMGTYFGLRRAIEDTVDHQLQVRSDNVAQFLKTSTIQQAAHEPQLLPKVIGLGPDDELYQVTSASGTMFYQSQAMRELVVPLDFTRMYNHYRHVAVAPEFKRVVNCDCLRHSFRGESLTSTRKAD